MSFTTLLNEIYEIVLEQSDKSRYDVLVDKWATGKKKASGKVVIATNFGGVKEIICKVVYLYTSIVTFSS